MHYQKTDDGARRMNAADKGKMALEVISAALMFLSSPYLFWLCFRVQRIFGAAMFRFLLCAASVLFW